MMRQGDRGDQKVYKLFGYPVLLSLFREEGRGEPAVNGEIRSTNT